ncbi:hypothetical protein B484DRAFT_483384 [Ochromonadaceae sp. CCMP2298]|nr:hypothetical protein B484DRAFT_483384 [Ochromonadaceae sp. CCMP2298]|mmetsp:Transcript_4438/g.10013  ORF Transcript_4438/g.10013 Transcript_4438/m.10013 type:complete len:586 (+) Transcript_4438:162-1919(+)
MEEEYQLKPSSGTAVPLLSLRASARLMGQLLGSADATIEFLSASEARIAVGGVEYDMKLSDVNATDVYCWDSTGDPERFAPSALSAPFAPSAPVLRWLGSLIGRMQVVGPGVADTVHASETRALVLALELGLGPREAGAEAGSPEGRKKRTIKEVDAEVGAPVPTRRTRGPAKKSKADDWEETLAPTTQSIAKAPINLRRMLLLPGVLWEVCARDLSASLFSGLSVDAVYVFPHVSSESNSNSESSAGVVDVYMDFTHFAGPELGLQRQGEDLVVAAPAFGDGGSSSGGNSGSNGGGNSGKDSSSSSGRVRRRIVPDIQAVSEEVACCARALGARLNGGSGGGSGGSAQHLLQGLQGLLGPDFMLGDPCAAAEQWAPVLRHWVGLNLPGAGKYSLAVAVAGVDAGAERYGSAQDSVFPGDAGYPGDSGSGSGAVVHVRTQHPQQVFQNPALTHLLCAPLFLDAGTGGHQVQAQEQAHIQAQAHMRQQALAAGVLADDPLLYSAQHDPQLQLYRGLCCEVDAQLRSVGALQAHLMLCCYGEGEGEGESGGGDGREALQHLSRRSAFLQAMAQLLWLLCSTHCLPAR